nr:double Clp-N motif-containing protein [Tanacetum cinerariifolium]
EELGTGTRKSENHLNGGIDFISSFIPHSNWGSKSTKFDDLLRERQSKSMLLKTLQDMSGRPPLIVYEQNTSPKASVVRVAGNEAVCEREVPKKERAGSSGEAGCSKQFSFFLRQDSSGGVESCHNLGGVYIIGSKKTLAFLQTSYLKGGKRQDDFKENIETPSVLEREASRACYRGDPITFMNVEEWGIFLITVLMFDGYSFLFLSPL